jgi:hypothetical protein
VFDDFGEREHVFDLLENEWAGPDVQDSYCLDNFVSGSKSLFRTKVKELSEKLAALEAKNTKPPRRLIHSHQSDILAELDFLLFICDRPSVLRANLFPLKLLLMDVWVISLELKAGVLKLSAAKGESFTGNKRGPSPLYQLVYEILLKHGSDTSAKEVWKLLKPHQGGGVIEEITDDENGGEIFICGKVEPTTFKSFVNGVSLTKKRLPPD